MRKQYTIPSTEIIRLGSDIVMQAALTGSSQEGSQSQNFAPRRPGDFLD